MSPRSFNTLLISLALMFFLLGSIFMPTAASNNTSMASILDQKPIMSTNKPLYASVSFERHVQVPRTDRRNSKRLRLHKEILPETEESVNFRL